MVKQSFSPNGVTSYGERENDWLTPEMFSSPIPIANYWKKMKELHQREAFRKEINKTSTKDTEKTINSNKRKSQSHQKTASRQNKRTKTFK
jgi:hypothetical protein